MAAWNRQEVFVVACIAFHDKDADGSAVDVFGRGVAGGDLVEPHDLTIRH